MHSTSGKKSQADKYAEQHSVAVGFIPSRWGHPHIVHNEYRSSASKRRVVPAYVYSTR